MKHKERVRSISRKDLPKDHPLTKIIKWGKSFGGTSTAIRSDARNNDKD